MVEEESLSRMRGAEADVKGRKGEKLIIFGPLGWWRAFRFCLRLRLSGVEYKLCRGPRSVAVRERNLNHAAWIFDGLPLLPTRGYPESDQGAE